MKFTRCQIPDLILCTPNVHGDSRGYFVETFREDRLFDFLGYEINFIQDNESKSSFGVLRGLHYQLPPFAQTKLVRVISGKVLDIAVDIREGSATFGRHVAIELDDISKNQLLIPRGFAHGFVVLSEEAIFSYKVDNYYNATTERGIAFDDKSLDINWQLDNPSLKLSSKDTIQPLLKDISELFEYGVDYYV